MPLEMYLAVVGSIVGLLGFILAMFNFVLRTIEKFHLKEGSLQDEIVALHKELANVKADISKLTVSMAILTQEKDMWKKRALNLLKAYKKLKNPPTNWGI